MTGADPTSLEDLPAECIARAEEEGPGAVEALLGEHPALAADEPSGSGARRRRWRASTTRTS